MTLVGYVTIIINIYTQILHRYEVLKPQWYLGNSSILRVMAITTAVGMSHLLGRYLACFLLKHSQVTWNPWIYMGTTPQHLSGLWTTLLFGPIITRSFSVLCGWSMKSTYNMKQLTMTVSGFVVRSRGGGGGGGGGGGNNLKCFMQSYSMIYLLMFPFYKNIERHTADTIASWPNPKQWVIGHISDLMMIIRQSIYIYIHNISINTR